MIGLYVPGRSPIHRLPAGVKLVALFLLGALAIWLDRPWQIAVALVVVLAGYPVAGLGLRVVLRQLKPLWLLLAVTLVLQLALVRLAAGGHGHRHASSYSCCSPRWSP